MDDRNGTITPGPIVALELLPEFHERVVASAPDEFEHRAVARVAAVMANHRIPGEPRLEIGPKPGTRAVCVFVDGDIISFPPSLLRRLWFGLAGAALHPLAFGGDDPRGYPDAWLRAAAAADEPDVRQAVLDVLECVPSEAVALRPSKLLTARAAGVSAEDERLMFVSRGLLDRGVMLPPRDELTRLLREHERAGRSARDALEDMFSLHRARSMQLRLSPALFSSVTRGNERERVRLDDGDGVLDRDVAAALEAVREHRLRGLGVRLPIDVVRSDDVGVDEIRLMVNDRIGPPIPIPAEHEVGVSAAAGVLSAAGVAARPLVDAVTGHELASVDAEDAPRVEVLGHVVVPRGAYIAAAFGRAVGPIAHRIVCVDDVEADLAAVEESDPSVVHGVLARFGLTTIVQLLRELIREQISTGELRTILNAMLRFSAIAPPPRELDAHLLAYVRSEIGARIVYDSGAVADVADGEMAAYVTDAAFEQRLRRLAAGDEPDREGALTGVRNEVWRALGASPPAEPVIVTAARARRALREALAYELPGARVLARSELPAAVTVREIGRIGVSTAQL